MLIGKRWFNIVSASIIWHNDQSWDIITYRRLSIFVVSLLLKGRICQLVTWQIRHTYTKVTMACIIDIDVTLLFQLYVCPMIFLTSLVCQMLTGGCAEGILCHLGNTVCAIFQLCPVLNDVTPLHASVCSSNHKSPFWQIPYQWESLVR